MLKAVSSTPEKKFAAWEKEFVICGSAPKHLCQEMMACIFNRRMRRAVKMSGDHNLRYRVTVKNMRPDDLGENGCG